jgi:hypothetical protein
VRRLLVSLVAASISAFAFEGLPGLHQPITFVVQSENPIEPKAFEEMQREMNRLLARSERRVEFLDRKQIQPGVDVADLTVVRFRGNCRMTVDPVYLDERGPLAFAHTADGDVLPFAEVLCDRVRKAALSAMHGGDHAKGQELMGRAMARVLAHELWHVKTNSTGHTKSGVTRHALSGKQLIADQLDFEQAHSPARTN